MPLCPTAGHDSVLTPLHVKQNLKYKKKYLKNTGR